MPTRKITRVFKRPAGPTSQPPEVERASLIDFLTALQRSEVSLLPIVPHKALGALGRGLSGSIQQSTADVSTVLAFKEGIPDKTLRDSVDSQDWYSLITEVTILQHKYIRDSHRFVDLLGITFYVPPSPSLRAWPLIVTARANRSDLAALLTAQESDVLPEGLRMQLFTEVIEAVYTLHQCDITHGDVKAENFLLEQSEEGELNCRLADFGSAAIKGQKRLPTLTEPWNAPELQGASDEVDFEMLQQADLYSLGLICLHILLPRSYLQQHGLFLFRLQEQAEGEWLEFLQTVNRAKNPSNSPTLGERLAEVIHASSIPTEHRDVLRLLVTSTIEPPQGKRWLPWLQARPFMQEYLSEIEVASDAIEAVNLPPIGYNIVTPDHSRHIIFDLDSMIGELDDVDYILRLNIYDDIQFKAKSSTCRSCRSDFALLASVCNAIGFGTELDQEIKTNWLQVSGKSDEDFIRALQQLGQNYKVTGRVAEKVIGGLGIGVLVSADRIEEYQVSQRLSEAERNLREETFARSQALGELHFSLAKLKTELSQILKYHNRLAEAEKHQRDAVEIFSKHHGADHPACLAANIALADILSGQGNFREAESIQQAVQSALEDVLGTSHPERITALLIFASMQANLGKLNEAEVLAKEAVLLRNQILSPTHPLTVRAEISLVTILRSQGKIREASELMANIDQKLAQSFVGDDFVTANLQLSQCILHTELGSHTLAMEAVRSAQRKIDKLNLAGDNDLRLSAMEALASVHEANRAFETAEFILRDVLNAKSSLEPHIPWVAGSKIRLAQNLLRQSKLEDAAVLAKDCLDINHASITDDPETLFACTEILVSVHSRKGERDLALSTCTQLYESCEREFGMQHPRSLRAAYLLGDSHAELGDLTGASKLYERVLRLLEVEERPNKEAVTVSRLAASVCRQLGNFDQAEIYCRQSIQLAERIYGDEHVETLASYNSLARLYTQRGKYPEAEGLYKEKLELQSKGTELEIYVKENIAELKSARDDRRSAMHLRSETYELMCSLRGERHPETIQMAGNILSDTMMANPLNADTERRALDLIDLKKEVLGPQHPSTIKSITDLGYAYSQNGRFPEAESLFKEVKDVCEAGALQNPDWYATFLGKWADLYHQMGLFDQAESLERRALDIRREIYDEGHRAVLVTMSNLATTLSAQEKYKDAEDLLRKVVAAYEAKVVYDSAFIPRLLNSKTSLATVLFHENELEESVSIYDELISRAPRLELGESQVNALKAQREVAFNSLTEES